MIRGRYYVTTHALSQFCSRFAPQMTRRGALDAIIAELAQHARAVVRQRNGMVRVRCRGGRYEFTALLSGDSEGSAPAVVTITAGSRGGRRGRPSRLRGRLRPAQ